VAAGSPYVAAGLPYVAAGLQPAEFSVQVENLHPLFVQVENLHPRLKTCTHG
jgi:hypothetical protein